MDDADEEYVAARVTVGRMTLGFMSTALIGTAARLGLADRIGDGTGDVDELAVATDVPAAQLIRLLRAMAASDLLVEEEPGRFRLTLAGSLLRTDREDSVDAFTRMFTDPAMSAGWQLLEQSLRTGRTGFDEVFGTDFFGYLKERPELSELFNRSMSAGTRGVGTRIAELVGPARFRTAADIGGGDGTLLAELLAARPETTGILVDTAEGVAQAAGVLGAAGVADRCRVEVADFFVSVPAGADLYVLKSIVHDWDDERAATILRNCREVIPDDGTLVLVEPVLPEVVPPDAFPSTYLSDLNMLVNVGGRERTRSDFKKLCTYSGFTLESIEPLYPPPHHVFCAVSAVPIR